jgi:1-acyl-sn-glycerol-3-phosphate acyltransferase
MWLLNLSIGILKILIGGSPRWVGCAPVKNQRIYFANHSSHADTILIWSALPHDLRIQTRPVAAADYWNKGVIKKYIAKSLNVVLINRLGTNSTNPLIPVFEALEQGYSLIIFPEGTRNQEAYPGTFKSGLFHLARKFPELELVPVYLENLYRSMPKGAFVPIPMICSVYFGKPIQTIEGEDKAKFLDRARQSIIELT